MAPCGEGTPNTITARVSIADIMVDALVDSGATTSCCGLKWYQKYYHQIGALAKDDSKVVGIGNQPIVVQGRTQPLPLLWEQAHTKISLLVVPTLHGYDVILGMDILTRLGVKIDARNRRAVPTVVPTYVQAATSRRIPAQMSLILTVNNPLSHEEDVLFEPSSSLPGNLRSTPVVGKGEKLHVRIENFGEETIVLTPEWTIGTLEVVEEGIIYGNEKDEDHSLPVLPGSLTGKQRREMKILLTKYQEIFDKKGKPLGGTQLIQHEIHTDGPPFRIPFRRQNPQVRLQEQEQLQEMLQDGVVRPSISPWASPVVMVKKKDGTLRFCIDFRKLNDQTIKDAQPLPRIDDTLDALKGAKYFSTLDLKSGYWQVPIKEEHKEKTAFRTSSGQLYEFNQLPFGLCNAPATFSRLMDQVLTGLSWKICLYYLDDIIVFSSTWEEHLRRLEEVFIRLREAHLKLSATKCTLARTEVIFLGHLVSSDGLRPDPRLLESIREIPVPSTITQVRSFLGLVGYYRRFVKGFSDIASPLNRLLEKTSSFTWTPACQTAYETLKSLLLQEPIVAYPDFSLPFRLYTDASNIGLGAILAQIQDGRERIICCASRTLNTAEKNYSATKKECLAIVWGVQSFRNYLIANPFQIYTDHYSLQWMRSMKSQSAILHRWAAALEDYQFEVKHRPGKNQGHVDGLSRLPLHQINFIDGELQTLDDEHTIREVLTCIHQEGHLGRKKTLQMFRKRFIGRSENKICKEVIRSCLGCQLGSDYRPKHHPKGQIESRSPWNILSIDIMGPLQRGRNGERFIMTIVDCFSKYTILVPIRDHTATTVSRILYERVVAYFGLPDRILTDRGTEFTGNVWTNLLMTLGIKPMMTSPYYPQGNAIVERSHRTIGNMLRAALAERKDEDWPTLLPGIMLSVNEMNQEAHGYTASQIMWGRGMKLPIDLIYPQTNNNKVYPGGYVSTVSKNLKDIRNKVAPFNRCRRAPEKNPFQVGDKIFILQQPMERDHKLSPKWRGPFVIRKILNPFQVIYCDLGRDKISHIMYCKRAYDNPSTRNGRTRFSPSPQAVYKAVAPGKQITPAPQRIAVGRNMFVNKIQVIMGGVVLAVDDASRWSKEISAKIAGDQEVSLAWVLVKKRNPRTEGLTSLLRTLVGHSTRLWKKCEFKTTGEQLQRCGHRFSEEGAVVTAPKNPELRASKKSRADQWSANENSGIKKAAISQTSQEYIRSTTNRQDFTSGPTAVDNGTSLPSSSSSSRGCQLDRPLDKDAIERHLRHSREERRYKRYGPRAVTPTPEVQYEEQKSRRYMRAYRHHMKSIPPMQLEVWRLPEPTCP